MSFTYAELKQAIEDYTENNEASFIRNIPLFIRQAEERILKNVQLSLFRKNATANALASKKYLPCPSDFLAPFSLSYVDPATSDKIFVEFKDVSFLQTYTPDDTTGSASVLCDLRHRELPVGSYARSGVCNGVALLLSSAKHHCSFGYRYDLAE